MILLDDFWDFVCFRPGLSATETEWTACLGANGWRLLRKQILVGDGASPTFTTPNGKTLQVVPMSSGAYSLVCPFTGNVEKSGVPEAEVRAYRLDVGALRAMVADALGISRDPQQVREFPRAFPVGNWSPVTGADIPAFIILPPTTRLLTSEIGRLLVEHSSGFVLLVPGAPRLSAALRASIDRQQAYVIPLKEVVACDASGRLLALPAWQTYRGAYCQRHLGDRMVPALPAYQFSKKNMWAIRFAGKETFLEGTLKGPVFIRYLLVHQGERIHVARMLADIAGDERLAQASNAGEAITPEEIARFRERYAELHAAKEEAAEWNDEGRVAEIEQELDQMAALLGPLFGLGGKSRKASDDVARIRKAIARVIGIALDKIGACDPALEQHLRNSIKTHSYMSYEPETRIDWQFE